MTGSASGRVIAIVVSLGLMGAWVHGQSIPALDMGSSSIVLDTNYTILEMHIYDASYRGTTSSGGGVNTVAVTSTLCCAVLGLPQVPAVHLSSLFWRKSMSR